MLKKCSPNRSPELCDFLHILVNAPKQKTLQPLICRVLVVLLLWSVARRGIEPLLPEWKSDVLTPRRTGRLVNFKLLAPSYRPPIRCLSLVACRSQHFHGCSQLPLQSSQPIGGVYLIWDCKDIRFREKSKADVKKWFFHRLSLECRCHLLPWRTPQRPKREPSSC